MHNSTEPYQEQVVQIGPMLGREVVKGKQHFFIFIQAFGVDPTVVSPAAILQQEHSFLTNTQHRSLNISRYECWRQGHTESVLFGRQLPGRRLVNGRAVYYFPCVFAAGRVVRTRWMRKGVANARHKSLPPRAGFQKVTSREIAKINSGKTGTIDSTAIG